MTFEQALFLVVFLGSAVCFALLIVLGTIGIAERATRVRLPWHDKP